MAFLYTHLVVAILGPEKLKPRAYSVLVLGPSSLDLTPSEDGIIGDYETQVLCEVLCVFFAKSSGVASLAAILPLSWVIRSRKGRRYQIPRHSWLI